MSTLGTHVCMEQADAPAEDAEFELDTRWVCSCGANFVYREGFDALGRRGSSWWPAPAPVVVPEQRRPGRLRIEMHFGRRRD